MTCLSIKSRDMHVAMRTGPIALSNIDMIELWMIYLWRREQTLNYRPPVGCTSECFLNSYRSLFS